MGRRLIPGQDKIEEDWVKGEIKKRLKPFKPSLHSFMPPAGMYGRSGIHDHCNVQKGCFWTIEAKAGDNTVTDNQIIFARDVKAAGGISLIINEFNLDDVIKVAMYIEVFGILPYHLCHDFDKYNDRKKRRTNRSSK